MPSNIRKVGDRYQVRKNVTRTLPSLAEARKYLKHLRSYITQADDDYGAGVAPCCTIREELETYLKFRMRGVGKRPCNEKTAALYRRRLLRFDAAFHSKPLNAISQKEVENWILKKCEKVSGDTVQAYIDTLKAFARWTQKRNRAPASLPLLRAERIYTRGKIAGKNRKPPKITDINFLLDVIDKITALRPDVGLAFYGILYFGIRPAGVTALRRSDLRLPVRGGNGTLEVKGLKGHPDRTLTIAKDSFAYQWVVKCLSLAASHGRDHGDHPLVICITGRSKRNPGGWTTDTLDQVTSRLCKKLGFTFRPYEIRHSIISWLQEQPDVDAAAVQEHSAHTKVTTQEVYSHRTAKNAKPAFNALEMLLKQRQRKTSEG